MNSEKVKEIKKVLEEGQFNTITHHQKEGKLIKISFADILTLINELESENKELKKYKLDWLNSEKMHLQADMEDTEFELFCANKSLNEVRAENKQLKDRIAELEKENGELNEKLTVFDPISAFADNYAKGVKEAEKVVVGALKQFAESLKEKAKQHYEDDTLRDFTLEYGDVEDTLKDFINKGDDRR